ncbi:MAG TPA: YggT family protein [Chloroflexota bacterium]|nr:YggT family protein [Chloroflexota bacterium]
MNVAETTHLFIYWLGTILTGAIVIRVLFSWFSMGNSGGPIVRLLDDITNPIITPLRRVIPPLGMIDISPLIAIVLIQFLTGILLSQITY